MRMRRRLRLSRDALCRFRCLLVVRSDSIAIESARVLHGSSAALEKVRCEWGSWPVCIAAAGPATRLRAGLLRQITQRRGLAVE